MMQKLKLPVEEFTTPNPITTPENTSIAELEKIMAENGIRHIPIEKDNKIVGILSDRDVRLVHSLNSEKLLHLKAKDIMVPNPVTVWATDSLDEVAFKMSEKKIGSVLVYDESDSFLGIFTVTDALNALIEIARSARIGKDIEF